MSQHTFQNFQYQPTKPQSQWLLVIGAHVLVIWLCLVATNSNHVLQVMTSSSLVVVDDVAIVPKPPAPKQLPKIQKDTFVKPDIKAPVESPTGIELAVSSEPNQQRFDPAPSLVPAVPPKIEAALICPTQIKPEIPRQALIKNIQGVIKVEAVVTQGAVKDVKFLSGPRIFFDSVRAAMLQYKCAIRTDSVVAMQEFNFHFD